MTPQSQLIINLPGFKILNVKNDNFLEIFVEFEGEVACHHCGSLSLRMKDSFIRRVRHTSFGNRLTQLHIRAHKFKCRDCGKYFNQRFPGIYPRKRSTESFREEVYLKHSDGVSKKRTSKRLQIAQATVERWSRDHLKFAESKQDRSKWPRVLGIDEHFFTRKKGFATTFADLTKRKVYDVALGRSQKSLEPYFERHPGRERVQVILMDLSDTYRAIARSQFPKAKIVADRFHVVRLINQKFMEAWKTLDPEGRKKRGLISLMRRHDFKLELHQKRNLRKYLQGVDGLETIYDFKQNLMKLMLQKKKRATECRKLIPDFLDSLELLKSSEMYCLKTLGETLYKWREEIVRMWRFTKTNSITEGLHNKMEELSRRAYGFRNFDNYRIRVRVYCGY